MEFYKSKYSDKKKSDKRRNRKNEPSRSFRNSGNDRGSRYSREEGRGESTTVTCSDCGTECQVPFVPRTNKPVYCSDCFRQNKPQDSGSDGDDRDSRQSSRRESRKTSSDLRKPRSDKFLRKQESFYSNGSDKFYETIKEKLYEILGGKVCSSCGFKDERALEISPIFDNGNDGRENNAASWGKYISSHDLAREELKVFCLNCNQIREPASKPNKSRSMSKKSKYFPR